MSLTSEPNPLRKSAPPRLTFHCQNVGPGGVPRRRLDLILQLVGRILVLVVLLCHHGLLSVPGVPQPLLSGNHGEEGAALLGVDHGADLVFRREPEVGLDHPPARNTKKGSGSGRDQDQDRHMSLTHFPTSSSRGRSCGTRRRA